MRTQQSINDALIAMNRQRLEAQFDREAELEGNAIKYRRQVYEIRRPRKPFGHSAPVSKQLRSL